MLTNGVNHTISGDGLLGNGSMSLVNSGLINANTPTSKGTTNGEGNGFWYPPSWLTVDGGTSGGYVTNYGTMQASNSGVLVLQNSQTNYGLIQAGGGGIVRLKELDLTNNGRIEALDNSAAVLDEGALVLGGTFATSGSGLIRVCHGAMASIAGTITNNAVVVVESPRSYDDTPTTLQIVGNTSLGGNGTITLSISNTAGYGTQITGADPSTAVLTLGPGQTINGTGLVGSGSLCIVNSGTIDANASGGALTVQPSGNGLTNYGTMRSSAGSLMLMSGNFTNTAIIEATNGSTVSFANCAVSNSGTIQALGGSLVQLGSGAYSSGGLIQADDRSAVQLIGGATVANATFSTSGSGVVIVPDGQTASLLGTITNNGSLLVASTGHNSTLFISGTTTLTGGGLLSLAKQGQGEASVSASSLGELLINGPQHTITGSGYLGTGSLSLVNSGLIDPAATTNNLTVMSGTLTNQGIAQATAAGSQSTGTTAKTPASCSAERRPNLNHRRHARQQQRHAGRRRPLDVVFGPDAGIWTSLLDNTGGTILAASGGLVRFDNCNASNGLIQAADGSTVQLTGNSTISNATFSTLGSGLVQVPDGQTAMLQGTITNNGLLSVTSTANTTVLGIGGTATLTGSGMVSLVSTSSSVAEVLGAYSAVLVNGIAIHGAGCLGCGNLGLVNSGLISADSIGGTLTVWPGSLGAVNRGLCRPAAECFSCKVEPSPTAAERSRPSEARSCKSAAARKSPAGWFRPTTVRPCSSLAGQRLTRPRFQRRAAGSSLSPMARRRP